MPHFQLGRKRLQSVVYPAAEQRRFHRAAPCFPAFLGPLPQHLVRRSQLAFFEDPPVGPFHAVADAFLVDIESDIVVDVHWVLLFEVSEPAVQSRSRHCTLQENPFSSAPLYIQTDDRFSSSVLLSLPIEHDSRRLVARPVPLRHSFMAIRFGMQQHVLGECGMRRQNEPPALPCYHGFALISRHTDSGAYDGSLVPVQYNSPHGGGLVAA